MKDPFSVIKERYITEKATVLERLYSATGNPSLERCKSPKYLFKVARDANKREIALAVEEIYREQKVKVVSVNTIQVKGKATSRRRGRPGRTAAFKKAIVTFEPGDSIESV